MHITDHHYVLITEIQYQQFEINVSVTQEEKLILQESSLVMKKYPEFLKEILNSIRNAILSHL